MNEEFDKIISQIEELANLNGNAYLDSADVIEIVKEVAEEYNGGWISCNERLPDDDKKEYIVQKTNGFVDILGFTKDAYKLSKYDFAEYKGKKKQLFYDYDSEYGYIECECEAWQPLLEPFKERD